MPNLVPLALIVFEV